jgi:hypothetical protein
MDDHAGLETFRAPRYSRWGFSGKRGRVAELAADPMWRRQLDAKPLVEQCLNEDANGRLVSLLTKNICPRQLSTLNTLRTESQADSPKSDSQ